MTFGRLVAILIIGSFGFSACTKDSDPEVPIADAGDPQTIQLPVNSVTLTGTGTTKNGKITGYVWSLVAGPNVPTIKSPGSSSTVVSNMVAGNYRFQLSVTDNAGLTAFDTTSVLVKSALQTTVTLQPANNDANELNFAVVNGQNASSHDIDLDAAAWTSGGSPTYVRGAFKFDLSGIPASATIISAKLSLYSNPTPINGDLIHANSGSNNTMYIRRIITSWSGLTATWQTQPATTITDQITVPHTNQSSLDLVDIDVKNLVDAMRISCNDGFMMMLQNETAFTIRQFASSNHPDATKRPKLVIVYQ